MNQKIIVVIAAYNEEALIASVVAGIKKHISNVVVVDDASGDRTADLAKEAGADVLISASYIWNSVNPEEQYKKLSSL